MVDSRVSLHLFQSLCFLEPNVYTFFLSYFLCLSLYLSIYLSIDLLPVALITSHYQTTYHTTSSVGALRWAGAAAATATPTVFRWSLQVGAMGAKFCQKVAKM